MVLNFQLVIVLQPDISLYDSLFEKNFLSLRGRIKDNITFAIFVNRRHSLNI